MFVICIVDLLRKTLTLRRLQAPKHKHDKSLRPMPPPKNRGRPTDGNPAQACSGLKLATTSACRRTLPRPMRTFELCIARCLIWPSLMDKHDIIPVPSGALPTTSMAHLKNFVGFRSGPTELEPVLRWFPRFRELDREETMRHPSLVPRAGAGI